MAALNKAMVERKTQGQAWGTFRRGMQYASREMYVLKEHRWIEHESGRESVRQCELREFMKNLKREHTDGKRYEDLGHIACENIAEVIEPVLNMAAAAKTHPRRWAIVLQKNSNSKLNLGTAASLSSATLVFSDHDDTRDKFFWGGGDVAPPRYPASSGGRKKTQRNASVPSKTVSLKGCSRSYGNKSRTKIGTNYQ